MNPVRIIKVGEVREIQTKYGAKKKRWYTVETMDTNEKMEVGYFLKKDSLDVKVGDEVLMDLSRDGKYINCKNIEIFEPGAIKSECPQEESPTDYKEVYAKGDPEEDNIWIEKDKRIARQNALRHATKIVVEACIQPEQTLTGSEVANLVLNIAPTIYEYIWTGGVPIKDKPNMADV